MTIEHELHDDDKPVGRILSRRELLKLLGGTGIVLTVGGGFIRVATAQTTTPTPTPTPTSIYTPIPACVVRPELTEGPYFVDGQLNRSDIRIDPTDDSVKAGIPIKIIFRVSDMTGGGCVPLVGAQVDIWHCDANGVYSGVESEGTANEMWLRGYQVTDENGIAEFISIYPGWYTGRAVHIHFKIRTTPQAESGYEFTSQFFFDEQLTDIVHAQKPYSAKGYRNMLNKDDGIFQQSGDLLTLDMVEGEVTDDEMGYVAIFDIGLDLDDEQVGADDNPNTGGNNMGGGNRPPRRP